ncbi:hypothetical protein Q7P35_001169 [Cladosporium inversicolor]
MPTYAILGATGLTSSSILDTLLQSSTKNPQNKIKINAFVRSKQKLLSMRPALASHPHTSIYEGQLPDTALLASCIVNTRAVFLCIATQDNVPHCTIAQEQTRAVLSALETNKNEKHDPENATSNPPKLIILSSASLSPHLTADLPTPFLSLMHTAASWMYADLRLAETYLRTHAPSNVELIFIKPGGLVHDAPVGHRLSTTRQQTFLSFADLGAGMVEAATSPAGRWAEAQGNVSVVPAGESTRVEWYVPWFLAKGCLFHFLPGLYPYLGGVLP